MKQESRKPAVRHDRNADQSSDDRSMLPIGVAPASLVPSDGPELSMPATATLAPSLRLEGADQRRARLTEEVELAVERFPVLTAAQRSRLGKIIRGEGAAVDAGAA